MRIYTEVNFEWDDKKGKLVEVSSDSFDYHGELALCEAPVWKTFYDSAGNEWKAKGEFSTYSATIGEVSAIKYYKNGKRVHWDKSPEGDNAWSNQVEVFEDFVKGKVSSYEDKKLYDNLDEVRDAWNTTFTDEPWNTDLTPAQREAYQTGDAPDREEESKRWQMENLDFDLNDDGSIDILDINLAPDDMKDTVAQAVQDTVEGGDWSEARIDEPLIEDEDKRKMFEIQKSALEDHLKNWKAIIDPEIGDEFQSAIDDATTSLGFAAEDVATAFGDIPSAAEDIQEDYLFDIGAAETTREEGLKGTVVGREEELETVREKYLGTPTAKGELREAEAKIGAAGFAATGVGKTAREMLASEIGEEAEEIDIAFTEKREKVKTGYTSEEEEILTTRERAGEDVTDPWKDASTAYERLSAGYESIIETQTMKAEKALGDIQLEMSQVIFDMQTIEPDYDPFAPGQVLGGMAEEFGWQPATGFASEAVEGLFGEYDQYTPFDPTSVNLYTEGTYRPPWEEEEEDTSGIPTIPGMGT